MNTPKTDAILIHKGELIAFLGKQDGSEALGFARSLNTPDTFFGVKLADLIDPASAPALVEALRWHLDTLDLGDVAFFEKYGFNVSEIFPRSRQALKEAGVA